MPNADSGSVTITRHCQYERYVEGKIPSIFKIDDKVEVNDLPILESGVDSQYDINSLTVNGHECKIGQYLIRVGSALFVVDNPELCGVIAPRWTDERVPDDVMDTIRYQQQASHTRPSRRYTERGAELHPDEVSRYRGRIYDRPTADRIQELRRTMDRSEPALDRAALERMMETVLHSTGVNYSIGELDTLVEDYRRQ